MEAARILIVEDEQIVAKDLEHVLGRLGYEVVGSASEGDEAVRKAFERRPDLILMDILLRGSPDGIDAADRIHVQLDVPVVYLTAYADDTILERAKETEPYGYLLKPFSEKELRTTLETALHKHKIEKRLRESEQRLELALEGADLGLWDLNVHTGAMVVNERWAQMLGYSLADIEPNLYWWEKSVHPDDRKALVRSLNAHLDGLTPIFESESRARSKSGEWKWILTRGKVVDRDPDGKALRCTGTRLDITERRRMEESLRWSEDRYRTVADFNYDWEYWIEQNRNLLYVSPSCERITGYAAEDFLEDSELLLAVVHPDDLEAFKRFFEEALDSKDKSPRSMDFRIVRPNGDARWIAHVCQPVFSAEGDSMGWRASNRDITERKRAEESLRESESRYRRLFEQSMDAIFIVTRDGQFVDANQAFFDIFGYSRSETLRMNLLDLYIDPADHLEYTQQLETVGSIRDGDWTARTKNGDSRNCLLSSTVLQGSDGAVSGYYCIVRDVTEQRQAQALILRNARLKAVGELASGVAHSFNNLLQIVQGNAEMAKSDAETGNCAQAVPLIDQILESVRLGSETVKLLQSFAGLREDVVPAGEVFDLTETVGQALEMSRMWWQDPLMDGNAAIDITSALQPSCPVQGSRSQLFEVAINLLRNAVEAMPDGGEIGLETYCQGTDAVFRVRDNGNGISRENIGRVFEPFFTTRGFDRAGMGLASSYGIVSRHAGEISVDSEEGKGATFTVRLPLAEAPPKLEADVGNQSEGESTILVIDDFLPVVEIFERLLTELGHTVLTATSGQEGIKIYDQNPVDLVICDLGMEGIDGWKVGQAVKEICRKRGKPKTPFLLVTGWARQFDNDAKLEESGVDLILPKPLDLKGLMESIDTLAHGPSPENDESIQE